MPGCRTTWFHSEFGLPATQQFEDRLAIHGAHFVVDDGVHAGGEGLENGDKAPRHEEDVSVPDGKEID